MITGNQSVLDNAVDLGALGYAFSSKPIVMGGLAMEYYGLRKRGDDIDFIISDEDYQGLAEKYPNHKMDQWGDLGIVVDRCDLLRSVFRLDYDFYSEGSVEYKTCKVMSFERLLFMKSMAFWNQPDSRKAADDFDLAMKRYLEAYQNEDYVKRSMQYVESYLKAPDGKVFNDNY